MIRTISNYPRFRITVMGSDKPGSPKTIVVHFHKRWSQLFAPLTWDYTHSSDIWLMHDEAVRLVEGRYTELSTPQARRQVQSIPAAAIGL